MTCHVDRNRIYGSCTLDTGDLHTCRYTHPNSPKEERIIDKMNCPHWRGTVERPKHIFKVCGHEWEWYEDGKNIRVRPVSMPREFTLPSYKDLGDLINVMEKAR